MESLTDTATPAAPAAPRRWPVYLLLLAVVAAGGAAAYVYGPWFKPAPTTPDVLSPEALDRRLLEAEQALAGMRRSQQSIDQRVTDTRARTDLLRDEVLGVSQRSAIIEDNVRELAAANRDSRDALRLDEAELLLGLAQTRLQVAGDLAGAVHATALAETALAALTDPQWVNLRQTLADELAALRSLPADPRMQAARELDALEAALPELAAPSAGFDVEGQPKPGLERLLDALIQVRASGAQDLLAPAERGAGEAALALELALARSAMAQRDDARFRASLSRIEQWLRRLYVDSPALQTQQRRLAELAAHSLAPEWPALGNTLKQLRELLRPARPQP